MTENSSDAPDTREAVEAGEQADDKKWYIIHTYSGFETKVKESLAQRARSMGLDHVIGEILIPTEDVVEMRSGKKVVTTKKFFPGYVLINMKMTDEAWHLVRSTPKVTGFVGTTQKATPLSQDEVDRIVHQISLTREQPKPRYTFERGETVRIIDGPFNTFSGTIEEVNEDRRTLKVMVSIFGRPTPVELDYLQVDKM